MTGFNTNIFIFMEQILPQISNVDAIAPDVICIEIRY